MIAGPAGRYAQARLTAQGRMTWLVRWTFHIDGIPPKQIAQQHHAPDPAEGMVISMGPCGRVMMSVGWVA